MKIFAGVLLSIVLYFFNVDVASAQFANVLIDDINSPEEPSITINPLNTNQVAAGANTDNYYYSTDGGASWTWGQLTSTLGVAGDPCLVADSLGNIFYFHLADSLNKIICQKSTDGGLSYDNGNFAWNSNTIMQDKEWAAADLHSNNLYVAWTQYDQGFNPGPQDSSNIFFSKSSDHGATFTQPIRLNEHAGDCLYLDITDPHPFAGIDGKVYVTFMDSDGIRFTKSLDTGNTWMPSPQLIDSGGIYRYDTVPYVLRVRAMPFSACDRSNSIYRGNIYVSWADDRNGAGNTDIFFIRSTDGGNSWSQAMKVNSDTTGACQYRNAMTVDQTNGYIYIVYFDRRNYGPNADSTDIYMSKSTDGGNTWIEYRIGSTGYEANANVFDGDYIDISAHAGIVRPIWNRIDNFVTSIWTCLYDESALAVPEINSEKNKNDFRIYPNPVNGYAWLSFTFFQKSLGVEIFDASGQIVKSIVLNNEKDKFVTLDELKPGIYFVKAGPEVRKMIKR